MAADIAQLMALADEYAGAGINYSAFYQAGEGHEQAAAKYGAARAALERALREALEPQPTKLYRQCSEHFGAPWPTLTVAVYPATKHVCPNCEAAAPKPEDE